MGDASPFSEPTPHPRAVLFNNCATVSHMSGEEACMLIGYAFTGRMSSGIELAEKHQLCAALSPLPHILEAAVGVLVALQCIWQA